MRVIGVVDLIAGRAVHARAGRRDQYLPLQSVAGTAIEPGDAQALAQAYVERFGVTELYAADLDAIRGAPPQAVTITTIASTAPLWLDAGVTTAEQARHAIGIGAAHVVVGLETLTSYEALSAICAAIGGGAVAFSLDLRAGTPIVATRGIAPGEPAPVVAARAVDAGAGALIVIDLARVGTGAGLDFELIASVRAAAPASTLLAGGGVHGLADLERLAAAGCDGALVATALIDGRIGAAEIAAAQRFDHRRAAR